MSAHPVARGPSSIQLLPSCGPAGTPVQVLGFNWRHNDPVTLSWLDPTGTAVSPQPTDLGDGDVSNQTYGFSTDFTVPLDSSNGTYTVRAVQDTVVNIPFKIPCDGPDLAAGPIVSSPSVTQGAPITFTVDITNTGSMSANDLFYVSLYFDPTPSPVLTSTGHISSTFRQDVVAVNRLNAGASTTVTFTVESLNEAVGTLPVYIVADSDPGPQGVISEMNELNNVATTQVTVQAGSPLSPPTGTITLTGQTRVQSGSNYFLQPYVQVTVFGGSDWLATTFSDGSGTYHFDELLHCRRATRTRSKPVSCRMDILLDLITGRRRGDDRWRNVRDPGSHT